MWRENLVPIQALQRRPHENSPCLLRPRSSGEQKLSCLRHHLKKTPSEKDLRRIREGSEKDLRRMQAPWLNPISLIFRSSLKEQNQVHLICRKFHSDFLERIFCLSLWKIQTLVASDQARWVKTLFNLNQNRWCWLCCLWFYCCCFKCCFWQDVFCFLTGDPRVNEQTVLCLIHTMMIRWC